MEKTKSAWCSTCNAQRAFVAKRPSGLLHSFLTIATCGAWLLVWPLFYARSGTGYSCPICGDKPGRKPATV